jgi:Tol biopolymer transport system component
LRGYLMHPDGSDERPLGAGVWVEYPAWSPDGTKLAFVAQTPVGTENYEIYVVDADGAGLRRSRTPRVRTAGRPGRRTGSESCSPPFATTALSPPPQRARQQGTSGHITPST